MRPNVFKYHDYRVFLKDTISHLQEKQKELSLRMLAQICGFAVGYLPMVLSGKRNLSVPNLEAMKKVLKLKTDELSYLKYMVAFNDSDSREEKLEIIKKMQKFQNYSDGNAKELEAYKYLTKWYYVALREMIVLDNFNYDVDWIQQQLHFSVSPKEIHEAMDFLLKNQFVTKDSKGKFQVKDKMLEAMMRTLKLLLPSFSTMTFSKAYQT